MSMGLTDADQLFNHAVELLRQRLACTCGGAFTEDEFLRQYHPVPALLNLLKRKPKTLQSCSSTKFSMLHKDVQSVFEDLNQHVDTGVSDGFLPCSYTDLADSGCAFKLESKRDDMPLAVAVAMKSCPASDVPFISVVALGGMINNVLKPCSATATCGTGLQCTDVVDLLEDGVVDGIDLDDGSTTARRRSALPMLERVRSLYTSSMRLNPFQQPPAATVQQEADEARTLTSGKYMARVGALAQKAAFISGLAPLQPAFAAVAGKLHKLTRAVSERVKAAGTLLSVHFAKRRLLATRTTESLDDDIFEIFKALGLYDGTDASPGCLPFSALVARMRAFMQIFFDEAEVADDSSFNFCLPDSDEMASNDIGGFLDDTFGIREEHGKLILPLVVWDGGMADGSNVFHVSRMDGSVFLGGNELAPPPLVAGSVPVLPVLGTRCDGTVFVQVGAKMGAAARVTGVKSIVDFALEQVMAMQQCRAKDRNGKYVFMRQDFLTHFALYTPVAWLSALAQPSAGKEFDIFEASHRAYSIVSDTWTWLSKMKHDQSNQQLIMSSMVSKWLMQELDLNTGVDFTVDMTGVGSCNAKDYGAKGCMMEINAQNIMGFRDPDDLKLTFGIKQCFSTAMAVPVPSMALTVSGKAVKATSPIEMCTQNSDCTPGDSCSDVLSDPLKDIPDLWDYLIFGDKCRKAVTNRTAATHSIVGGRVPDDAAPSVMDCQSGSDGTSSYCNCQWEDGWHDHCFNNSCACYKCDKSHPVRKWSSEVSHEGLKCYAECNPGEKLFHFYDNSPPKYQYQAPVLCYPSPKVGYLTKQGSEKCCPAAAIQPTAPDGNITAGQVGRIYTQTSQRCCGSANECNSSSPLAVRNDSLLQVASPNITSCPSGDSSSFGSCGCEWGAFPYTRPRFDLQLDPVRDPAEPFRDPSLTYSRVECYKCPEGYYQHAHDGNNFSPRCLKCSSGYLRRVTDSLRQLHLPIGVVTLQEYACYDSCPAGLVMTPFDQEMAVQCDGTSAEVIAKLPEKTSGLDIEVFSANATDCSYSKESPGCNCNSPVGTDHHAMNVIAVMLRDSWLTLGGCGCAGTAALSLRRVRMLQMSGRLQLNESPPQFTSSLHQVFLWSRGVRQWRMLLRGVRAGRRGEVEEWRPTLLPKLPVGAVHANAGRREKHFVPHWLLPMALP